jgi:hypothetical protein
VPRLSNQAATPGVPRYCEGHDEAIANTTPDRSERYPAWNRPSGAGLVARPASGMTSATMERDKTVGIIMLPFYFERGMAAIAFG